MHTLLHTQYTGCTVLEGMLKRCFLGALRVQYSAVVSLLSLVFSALSAGCGHLCAGRTILGGDAVSEGSRRCDSHRRELDVRGSQRQGQRARRGEGLRVVRALRNTRRGMKGRGL